VLDLSQPAAEASALGWTKLYNFRTWYQVADMSSESLKQIYAKLASDDGFFQSHYLLNTAGHRNC
jgi:hypothetical protein